MSNRASSLDPELRAHKALAPAEDRAALLAVACEQRDVGRLAEAEAACRRALELGDGADARRVLGSILQAQDRSAAALESFQDALRLDPKDGVVYARLALALAEQGRIAEAIAADRKALALRPGYVSALSHLSTLKRFESADDADLRTLRDLLDTPNRLEPGERVLALFALAKAYDDLGDYDRAFDRVREANALRRSTLEYDVAREERLFGSVAAGFDKALLERFAGAGSDSELPILIVGMPRSGTTLVEQILASHPAVYGGGERSDLGQMSAAVGLLSETRVDFPEGIKDVSREHLRRLGEGYADRLQGLAPAAARVTDKAGANFFRLGFARMIVPKAHVIHCVRDPRDIAVSCYFANFGELPFAFDLVDIARYHNAYARLMEHWRQVLPAGWMLEVRYEDLVTDFEAGVRRLLAHCGLEWDDACLRFSSANRSVRTASVAQVRQPLYSTSVGRWRRYERHLAPLLETLAGGGVETGRPG